MGISRTALLQQDHHHQKWECNRFLWGIFGSIVNILQSMSCLKSKIRIYSAWEAPNSNYMPPLSYFSHLMSLEYSRKLWSHEEGKLRSNQKSCISYLLLCTQFLPAWMRNCTYNAQIFYNNIHSRNLWKIPQKLEFEKALKWASLWNNMSL